MTIKVQYLSEDEIETEAELLLAEYADTAGRLRLWKDSPH